MVAKKESSDNVRVVVRCRPLNQKEKDMNTPMAVKCDEARGTVSIKAADGRSSEPPKVFTYDRVFGPDSKQPDVYNDAARSMSKVLLRATMAQYLPMVKQELEKLLRWKV